MMNRRPGLSLALILSMLLGLGGAVLAQDTNTVGPAQLKDFQLPGRRTTPPIATPSQPVQTTPTQTQPTQTAPVATQPGPQPQPRPTPPAVALERRNAPAVVRRPAPAIAEPVETPPAPGQVEPRLPQPPAAAPANTVPVETAPPAAAADPSSPAPWSWFWLLLPAFVGLAALVAFRAHRRRSKPESKESLGSVLAPEPAAEPLAAQPAVAPQAGPRPWLELDFVPEKAAATPTEAIVHFELVMRNVGSAPARNIRIDARMFNAGAQADIGRFLNGPIHPNSGSPHVQIEPGGELKLASRVAMPKEDVREIVVQGRSIFVPIVGANIAYDWGQSGSGRTSKSWLIGREAPSPAAKMGAFRLDQGPRIYRSVGRREAELAQMV